MYMVAKSNGKNERCFSSSKQMERRKRAGVDLAVSHFGSEASFRSAE
jgi:hypothetical protein